MNFLTKQKSSHVSVEVFIMTPECSTEFNELILYALVRKEILSFVLYLEEIIRSVKPKHSSTFSNF